MPEKDSLIPEDLGSDREKEIGQHIGYRYDVNLLPNYQRLTPFLKKYIETMGWDDLNWLEDVHMGYEEDRAAVFDRNINGWVTVPETLELPDNQQDRDMIARELLIKFQMSKRHPMVQPVQGQIDLVIGPRGFVLCADQIIPVENLKQASERAAVR